MKKIVIAAAMAIALSRFADATPITGAAAIAGLATFSTTGIDFHPPTFVLGASGTLAVMLSSPFGVVMDDITFGSAIGSELFHWNGLGTTINFTILSASESTIGRFLNISGTGMMGETGDTSTLYDFTLASSASGLTAFELNAAPPIPEPTPLLLLGTGLALLGVLLYFKQVLGGKHNHANRAG